MNLFVYRNNVIFKCAQCSSIIILDLVRGFSTKLLSMEIALLLILLVQVKKVQFKVEPRP